MVAFDLSRNQVNAIAADLEDQLAAALDEALAAPVWRSDPGLGRPALPEGRALALDLGGSRVRAALVRWTEGRASVETGPLMGDMPWQRGIPLDRERFLDIQAELIERLDPPAGLPLGYCFSYPTRATADGDGRLTRWTKGIEVPDMVGQPVGRLLAEHLARRGRVCCGRVRVINDAAALLHASLTEPAADFRIGLVVGTGTNLAVAWPWIDPQAPGRAARGQVAVSLESGRFRPLHLTASDEALDAASENPGAQRLEKAVSGLYLQRLLQKACAPADPGGLPSLAALAEACPDAGDRAGSVARSLVRRSAMIVAALLAAAITLRRRAVPLKTVRVVAEGGLYWSRFQGRLLYSETVARSLSGLLAARQGPARVRVDIGVVADATLVGSALAAMS